MSATRNIAGSTATAGPRRRLTARSVLASLLLGVDPPQLPTATLVSGAELLGVAPGTARVAISRMVADGELAANGEGYRLAGHLLARRARQDLSRRGAAGPWDGTWTTRIVPAEARTAAERAELRTAMATLRYGEVRDGAWMRPANLPSGVLPEAEAAAERWTIHVVGTVDDPTALGASLWDLRAWREGAEALLREVRPLEQRLAHDDLAAMAASFEVAAATLRHLQADPLLPGPVLPGRWPGAELRARHEAFEAEFRRVLRTWHRSR